MSPTTLLAVVESATQSTSTLALGPLFGITPDIALPPFWAYPAAIMLLILVGVTSLGLAKLYVKIKVALGLQ